MKPIKKLRSPVCYMIRKRNCIHYPKATRHTRVNPGPLTEVEWVGAIHEAIGFATLKQAEKFVERCIPPSEDVVIFGVHLIPAESQPTQ